MKTCVIAGIVTYNPNIDVLECNLSAVSVQVEQVLIVDNNSNNITDINNLAIRYDNVVLIKLTENKGIAKALNILCDRGLNCGANWLLTLDQDTIIPSNLIREYSYYVDDRCIGLIGCHINDRNIHEQNLFEQANDTPNTLITSGTLTNLSVWKKLDGFCEKLFIDGVDFEYCYRLKKNHFKILRVGNVQINHAVGNSKLITIKNKYFQLYGESPMRYYYIFRNDIYLIRHYKEFFLEPYGNSLCKYIRIKLLYVVLMLKYEDRGFTKLKMIIKGVFHGLMNRYGKYEER